MEGITAPLCWLDGRYLPLNPPPAAWPEHGSKLYTHDFLRQMPEVKTIDDLMAIRLQPWLKAQGAG